MAERGSTRVFMRGEEYAGRLLFVCHRGTRTKLGSYSIVNEPHRGAIGGRYIALANHDCTSLCNGPCVGRLDLRNLRSRGRWVCLPYSDSAVSDLAVRATGQIAFITWFSSPDLPAPIVKVWSYNGRSTSPELLDEGAIIEDSLAQRGNRITWLKDGERVSRPFR